MGTFSRASCRSCGASIIWTVTESGARMPVDAKPEKRLVLEERGDPARDVGTELEAPGSRVVDTYVSHFATCPDAAKHRKPRSS